MSTFIIAAVIAAAASTFGLMTGRKWGLAAGRKRTQKALAAQKAEFDRQQSEIKTIETLHAEQTEQIEECDSAEEAADVLADIGNSWNSGE
ncbi:hypothetical protein P0082_01035 [Candidatus Haliotispira prima]|uniref:Uncharacterized protein n=1 Tax=Candidatus Haliotispira prima TaxID=3034016 RepID=A0ABY8MJU7_9SPIO|nr:hypothetical protein P0082_01035 [Candidatus Haliotispira prima]